MRELLRAMAKAEMARRGYSHINRHMSAEWRRVSEMAQASRRSEKMR